MPTISKSHYFRGLVLTAVLRKSETGGSTPEARSRQAAVQRAAEGKLKTAGDVNPQKPALNVSRERSHVFFLQGAAARRRNFLRAGFSFPCKPSHNVRIFLEGTAAQTCCHEQATSKF